MDDKDKIRRGYDALAETYAERRHVSERERAVLDEFLDNHSQPSCILDAGCGDGTPVLQHLSESTATIGLDFSQEQLTLAGKTVPAARLVQGEMTNLPFKNNTFDIVFAWNSLIHVPLPEHQPVLDEFARVLGPNGAVLLSEAAETFERTNPDWLDRDVLMTWSMAGVETTREQLRNAGFRIVTEWEVPNTSTNEVPKPPFLAAHLDT